MMFLACSVLNLAGMFELKTGILLKYYASCLTILSNFWLCHTPVIVVLHTDIHLRLVIQHHYTLKNVIICEYFL